ncbi:MAG: enoyl-CoA hydratase [Hyphomicrobiales bacterium]|nr:enoyl-CoA hydratase [Hyphomicrobiales bacterium]
MTVSLFEPPIRIDDADGLRRVTLADPGRRNALSLRMIAALTDAIAQSGVDDAVRVVILAAEGPAFSAGHDLKELTAARAMDDRGRAVFEETMRACADLMLAIVRCPKPVIAEVAGVATAAGCQLVATCDLAVAAETAKFATPGVHIGLFCSTPMVALTRNLARKHAMEMLLTGAPVDAAEAQRLGLVNRVVAAETLTAETETLARLIASKSPLTLKIGKEAFYAQAEMGLAEAYDYAARVMVENMLTRDAEEGISAFVEKRHPTWEGR